MAIAGLATALSDCMDEVVAELARGLPDGVAVVATGGYGQGLLAPYSDIDVLVLSRRRLAAEDVRPVLVPLWDANLRVGHAVRTVKETVGAVGGDLTTLAAHLTMRRLWGPEELVGEVDRRIDKSASVRSRTIQDALIAEERHRRRRNPHQLLASDLKRGRGGLRSLDLVTWVRRLGMVDVDPAEVLDARRRLFDLRTALHLAAGRAHETPDPELRSTAGRLLGVDPKKLIGDVVALTDEVEAIVERAVPGVGRRRDPSWSPPPTPDDPTLGWAINDALHGEDDASLPDLSEATQPGWTPSDRHALLWLMTDARGRDGLRSLTRAGWVERMLPEWERIRLEPHVVPFHTHPVGPHSLRAADELPTCEAWHELSEHDRTVLRWAAILHDVGKGSGNDHAAEGARIVERIGTRMRWPRADTLMVQRLVRHHLDLVEMATRRDMSDPRVILAAARHFGDQRLLRLLAVLTEADSKATGTETWTQWKATLVGEAVRRIAAAMEAPPRLPGALLGILMSLTGLPSETVGRHLGNVSDDYRTRVTHEEMARDLRMIAAGGSGELRAAVSTAVSGSAVVAVVAPDCHGLVAAITGVFAVFGLNILAAELYTRSDGIACDRFTVETRTDADRSNLDRAVADLVRGGWRADDLDEQVAAKAHAYRHEVRLGVDPGVRVSGRGTAWELELRAADRRGLLQDVTRALSDLELDLVQVRVDTRAGVAYDTLRVVGRTDKATLTAAILAVL